MDPLAEYEGTITPAIMQSHDAHRRARDFLQKLPLRLGRVVRVHHPSDPTSRSRLFHEYDVLADTSSEHSPTSRVLLEHCVVASAFGGVADFSQHTLRQLSRDHLDVNDFGLESQVLVLLVNASAGAGVIIGGIQHPQQVPDTQLGHHLTWEFNGVRCTIDNRGTFKILRKGPTDVRGNPLLDAEAPGSFFEINAGGELRGHAVTDWVQTADFDIKLFASADVQATGREVFVTSQLPLGAIHLDSSGGFVKTSGLGVWLGGDAATDQMILGTTYRAAEALTNTAVAAGTSSAASAWGSTSAAIGALAPLVLGLDPSGTVTSLLAQAALVETVAASAEAGAASAVTSFEGGGPSYLSLKNKLDR